MSNDLSSVFALALEHKINGRYAEAEAGFKSVISSAPSHAEAHHELGLIYSFQVLIDESLLELETAVRLEPNSITYMLSLAKTLTMFGEFDRAKSLFSQILDVDPFNDEAAKNMDYLRSV
ncbi:MAG: hypothetical protein ACKO14_04290 [Armatimonadota bacterium]